ncbi:MAG: M28 family peptidase [Deinococcota bacterium]
MSTTQALVEVMQTHLHELSVTIGARPTGTVANHEAATYIAQVFTDNGFEVETQSFPCMTWAQAGGVLNVNETSYQVSPSPYSLPCDVEASIVVVESLEQLEAAAITGKIVLLGGDLSAEVLMPKNFTFYNPNHHRNLIRLLETETPAALLTRSLHPANYLPIFEDGDFNIPSGVINQQDYAVVVADAKDISQLKLDCQRDDTTAANVIARKHSEHPSKVVIMAHFDTKPGTPGALDNASGVAALLSMSSLLKDINIGVELIAFNGEDYFSVPGQMVYLTAYSDTFSNIKLAINCDGIGLRDSKTAVSLLECPETYSHHITTLINQSTPAFEQIAPWYQGDHMMFASASVPSIALTSTGIFPLIDEVIHTDNDILELIDPHVISNICLFMKEVVVGI